MNHKNACLGSLKIKVCNSLTGQLPSYLKRLEIESCEKLEYLWDDNEESCTSLVDEENPNNTNTSLLEYLYVGKCPSFKCLSSSGHLPEALRILSLHSLPELESISKTFLNSRSLEKIIIKYCKNPKSIPEGLHNLSHLRKIEIFNCESIDCLGEEGPPNTNLSELAIEYCEKLKALPNWFHNLNSLKSLMLFGCPSMTSFPEEGFPTNLTSLSIDGKVKMYKAVLEWGLHNLTSLTSLEIWGLPEAESFPQQEMGMTFPPSLTHLSIYTYPNLKCLMGEGFRNLNSLEYLFIYGCPNLTSFPELALPSSLKSLWINNCPNWKSFSKLGLPSSLSKLVIYNCPEFRSFPDQGLPSSLSILEISDCPEVRSFPKQGLPSSLLQLASSTFLIHLSCGEDMDILGPLYQIWLLVLLVKSTDFVGKLPLASPIRLGTLGALEFDVLQQICFNDNRFLLLIVVSEQMHWCIILGFPMIPEIQPSSVENRLRAQGSSSVHTYLCDNKVLIMSLLQEAIKLTYAVYLEGNLNDHLYIYGSTKVCDGLMAWNLNTLSNVKSVKPSSSAQDWLSSRGQCIDPLPLVSVIPQVTMTRFQWEVNYDGQPLLDFEKLRLIGYCGTLVAWRPSISCASRNMLEYITICASIVVSGQLHWSILLGLIKASSAQNRLRAHYILPSCCFKPQSNKTQTEYYSITGAHPNENVSVHGFNSSSLLMASRFTVASYSLCPPDNNTIPGTSGGTVRRSAVTVKVCIGPSDHLRCSPAQCRNGFLNSLDLTQVLMYNGVWGVDVWLQEGVCCGECKPSQMNDISVPEGLLASQRAPYSDRDVIKVGLIFYICIFWTSSSIYVHLSIRKDLFGERKESSVRDEPCLSSSAQLAHISSSSLVNSQLNRINELESNLVDKVGSYGQVSRGSTYQAGLALCASIDKPDQRCTVDDIKLSKGQVGYKVS
ncbi:hypothetical protein EZV62_009298 [Acer yangbiense]|uniref:Uncharacterized protein n=1 Tax=Acer yangbiense TaxID=1000413 RepID=A0A5C7IFM2_9ROSI|nr:hypothetical protein EZV62_009298 [Acer yangbiense]